MAKSLEAIHHSHHEIVGVVTVADKPSGRGQNLPNPVKKYTVENNLPIFQPEKLRNPEFLEEMRKLEADVFVVVAFRMMPKVLFEMPKLELSIFTQVYCLITEVLLPINFAIINGEEKRELLLFYQRKNR